MTYREEVRVVLQLLISRVTGHVDSNVGYRVN
jgi:hypothetical protein